jgi:predicted metal-dependent enzyme (double-stranded beta helix superfamily)
VHRRLNRGLIRALAPKSGEEEDKIIFKKDHFIQDCTNAVAEGQEAIREVVAKAVSDNAAVMTELGEPQHAGITPIHRSHTLTIINFVWAPCMSLMPHNHQMFSVVGIYSGREDNVFWRRTETTLEAAGAKSLGVGDVATLGRDIIHSVLNPIGKMTCAIHVYGGDFFAPDEPRSEWDHETLIERPWNIEKVKSLFLEAEARFNATKK